MFTPTLVAAILSLASLGTAVPADHLEARSAAACSKDALYTSLMCAEHSSAANAFCSTYIKQTVTRTSTKVMTLTSSSTVTPSPITLTVTSVVTSTSTATSTSSFLETTSNTIYKRAPSTVKTSSSTKSSSSAKTSSSSSVSKSSSSTATAKTSSAGYPSFISASYAASKVSSACSCVITPSLLKTATLSKTITQTTILKGTTTLNPSTALRTTTTTTVLPTTSVVAAPTDIYCGVAGVANGATLIQDSWNLRNDSSSCMQWCGEHQCSMMHFGCPDECYCALYSSNDLSQMFNMGSGSYGKAYTFWDSRCDLTNAAVQEVLGALGHS